MAPAPRQRCAAWLCLALIAAGAAAHATAQDPARAAPPLPTGKEAEVARLRDLTEFGAWLDNYRVGAFRFVKDGKDDPEAVSTVARLMASLARWDNLPAARKLFEVASLEPVPPGEATAVQRLDFDRELQPWRARAMACETIAAMQGAGIEEWLVGLLKARPAAKDQGAAARGAAMRILGQRPGVAPRLALLEAARNLGPRDRVRALNVLSQHASCELLDPFLDLLKDTEPNVRITALNGIAAALGPRTDQTISPAPPADAELDKRRDQIIARCRELLMHDSVWQVRAAAREALAALRCKQAIPALIDGLDAELGRKKDPWSLDVHLHRTLEHLTGQRVPLGSVQPWKEFWRREGASFAFARGSKQAPAKKAAPDERYQKFFNLEVDSDRVLFVLDFSGSMDEPATLQSKTTAAGPGESTTKAKLVVKELERIVMALPNGTMFNVIVFSDDVRIWRADRNGRPALVRLDDQARDDLAGSFLPNLVPRGPTNLYGALNAALDFAGSGLHDRYYETGYDTLYVLSDGGPTYGEITDRDEILRVVRETNALRRITIHCVTFGDRNEMQFLARLAEQNGGRHIHVD